MTEKEIAEKFVGYLSKSLTGNSELKNFITDFTDATVRWIQPLFLKDEEPLKQFKKKPLDDLNISEIVVKVAKELRENTLMKENLTELINKVDTSNKNAVINQQSTGDYSPVIGKIESGGIGQQINNLIKPPKPPKS